MNETRIIEEMQRDIEKRRADFDKELQQQIKAAEKRSKAFAKDIKKLSRKSSALANGLSDSKLKEVISASGTLLQTGFLLLIHHILLWCVKLLYL